MWTCQTVFGCWGQKRPSPVGIGLILFGKILEKVKEKSLKLTFWLEISIQFAVQAARVSNLLKISGLVVTQSSMHHCIFAFPSETLIIVQLSLLVDSHSFIFEFSQTLITVRLLLQFDFHYSVMVGSYYSHTRPNLKRFLAWDIRTRLLPRLTHQNSPR